MAAIGQPIESDVRDQPPEPASTSLAPPTASDAMQVDTHINGFASSQDAGGSERPLPPLHKTDQPNGFSAPAPPLDPLSSGAPAPAQAHVSKLDPPSAQPLVPSISQSSSSEQDQAPPVAPAAPEPAPPLPLEPLQAAPPPAAEQTSLPPLSSVPPTSSVPPATEPPILPPLQQIPAVAPSAPAPASAPVPVPALPAAVTSEHATHAPVTDAPAIATSKADSSSSVPATAGPFDQPAPSDLSDGAPAPLVSTAPVKSESTGPLSASAPVLPLEPVPAISPIPAAATVPPSNPSAAPVDQEMHDVSSSATKVAREREDDEEGGPDAKRAKMETEAQVQSEQSTVFKVPELPRTPGTEQPPSNGTIAPASQTADATPPVQATTVEAPAAPAPTPAPVAAAGSEAAQAAAAQTAIGPIDSGPMTDAQQKKLLEGMRSLKKTKHSVPFQKPVDYVALNLPTYTTIIKRPMDLGTMEAKLREHQYASVDAYVDDFNTMVQNSITFNGPAHVVSHQGMNMKRQLEVQLRKLLPRANEPTAPAPPKVPKQPTVTTPRESKRRESRPSLGSAQSPNSEAFALGPNGVPFIRRDSMAADGRPKREIHRPPPRDLPYSSKPKRKKFMMELKFCEYIQEEMMRPRYYTFGWPFYEPVDAVGLGLTDYHKVIRRPMDIGTIGRNLKSGQYESAGDYEADVRLMFSNCFKYNKPHEHVFSLGKQYENVFDELWKKKEDWILANTPASERQSPEAGDSSEEESSEDEDDEEDARNAQLTELQKQIALLNEQAAALLQGKIAKATKSKDKSKPGKAGKGAKKNRKSGGGPSSSKTEKKSKTKSKVKPVTLAQKQEISEKVVLLGQDQQARALNLITSSLHAAGRHEEAKKGEEGEFDIEKIPDETLHELLKMVRKHVGGGSSAADDGAAADRSKSHHHHSSKPKKNKPMSKYEQEDRISRLKGQLQSFQNPGSTSQSPELGDAKSDSSGDESDSGSESEEE